MSMYTTQFRSRRRRHNEDIQCLADMAWLFMAAQAKKELVVDQILMGMESMKKSDMLLDHANRPHKPGL